MTNVTAIWLGAAIIGFLLLDHYYLRWDVVLFVGREMLILIEAMKIWQ